VFENYFPSIALQLYTVILETHVALIPAYFIFNFIFHATGNPFETVKDIYAAFNANATAVLNLL